MKKGILSLALVLAILAGATVKGYSSWIIVIYGDGTYTAEYIHDNQNNVWIID